MANTIYFPNLKKDDQRPIATGTVKTVSGEDHACLDVFIQNDSLAPVAVGPLKFTRNGSDQVVTEDTTTPANNRPLPVKLIDASGAVTITANNLEVQLSHSGANPDSVRIGDGTETVSITASNQMEVAVTAALPAGTNNIGDVDVLSVVPGTGATNLGKAESATHSSGDTGIMCLAVRNDAGSLMAADGEYIPFSINSSGELRVTSTAATEVATAADGGALPALTKVVSGFDGTNVQVIKTDVAGELQVDVLTQPARSHTTDSIRIGDGTDLANVTASNQLEVAVTAALPAGTNNIGDVDVLSQPARSHTVDSFRIGDGTDLANVTAANQLEVAVTAALPSGTNNIGDVDVLSQPARSHTTDSIRIGDGVDLANVTAANQLEVAVTASLPAGTNNIGDVDILSIVPGTSATSLGKAESATHSSGDTGVMSLAVRNDAGTALAANGEYIPFSTDSTGALRTVEKALSTVDFFDTPLLDASSTNIPGSAANSLQVIASLASAVRKIQVFDTTGEFFGIFTGAVSSPTLVAVVGPGSNETVDASIAAGTIISLRSLTTTAISSGNVTMNFMG
jgi:hypothetical protein